MKGVKKLHQASNRTRTSLNNSNTTRHYHNKDKTYAHRHFQKSVYGTRTTIVLQCSNSLLHDRTVCRIRTCAKRKRSVPRTETLITHGSLEGQCIHPRYHRSQRRHYEKMMKHKVLLYQQERKRLSTIPNYSMSSSSNHRRTHHRYIRLKSTTRRSD